MKDLPKIEKSFKYWQRQELLNFFGITFQANFPLLEQWITTPIEITASELAQLQVFREEIAIEIDSWNETELREDFIRPLTRLVKFKNYQKQIKGFAERTLSVVVKNEIIQAKLHGVVDWLVATGLQTPKHPFFFIHEYKAEGKQALDGRGQLLAAMFAAQQLNQTPPMPSLFDLKPKHFYKDIPIYGAYVTGRLWFFVVLKGKDYSISSSFDCTKEQDLQAIFKILKTQKQIIYSYLEK